MSFLKDVSRAFLGEEHAPAEIVVATCPKCGFVGFIPMGPIVKPQIADGKDVTLAPQGHFGRCSACNAPYCVGPQGAYLTKTPQPVASAEVPTPKRQENGERRPLRDDDLRFGGPGRRK